MKKDIKTKGPKPMSKEEFLKRAHKIYGDRFNYSLEQFNGLRSQITVVSKETGYSFKISALRHLNLKDGGVNQKGSPLHLKEFLKRAHETHGDRFDYSVAEFNGIQSQVTVVIKETGDSFKISAKRHLALKDGGVKKHLRAMATKALGSMSKSFTVKLSRK